MTDDERMAAVARALLDVYEDDPEQMNLYRAMAEDLHAALEAEGYAVVRADAPQDVGPLLDKAQRWRDRGLFTDDQWGAVCAVLLVHDIASDEDIERGRELARKYVAAGPS